MLPTVVLLVAAQPAPVEAFRKAERLAAEDRFGDAEPLYRAALATDDRFLKRQAYNRLMSLYVRSGRPDQALRIGEAFRAWLKTVGDPDGSGALELLTAQCHLDLGYPDAAEAHVNAALGAKPPLASPLMLDALRVRCETAALKRDGSEARRWAELERAAAEALKVAERTHAAAGRVAAARVLAEALAKRGDRAAALAALDGLPDLHDQLADPAGRRDTQLQRAKLLAARGQFAGAEPLFAEALALHQKAQPEQRVTAGDVLAEWAAAAVAAGKPADAAKLRDRAAAEYKAALGATADAGGALAAFVRLQALTRSAKQFAQALDAARQADARWSGDTLLHARLKSDRGTLELMAAAYPAARKLLTAALADLETAQPVNLRVLPKVLVNLAAAQLGCDAPEDAEGALKRCAELYRKHKLPPDALRVEADYLFGVAASRRGDFAGAIGCFRDGLARCDLVGADAEATRFNLWLNSALIQKEQGDVAAAGAALARAAEVLGRLGERDDLSGVLIDAVRADLYLSQGQVKSAAALVPALEAAGTRGGRQSEYLWAAARHIRALDALTRKDLVTAEAVWNELAAAQRATGDVLLARTLNFLGVCAELRGADADALKRFAESRAFQAGRPRCPPATCAITLWRLAVLTDKAGKPHEAKKLLGEVFDIADRARLSTFGEAAQRAQFFVQFAPMFELLAAWCARDGDGEGLLRVVTRSRSRTLLDQMLAAGVDPRDRLPADTRKELLEREAGARRTVSRLRSRAMLFTPEQADEPEAKQLAAELEAAQKQYADAWREIANADPMTRVLTDPAFAEQALAQVRKEAHRAGGALLTYMVGRDASFAVLSTDPAAAPQVFRLGVAQAVAADVGEPPAGELVARAGFRGVAVRAVAPQPERPLAAPAEAVALTDAVAARLVNHYLRQIADPSFNPTRGIALVSRTAGQGTRAIAAEGIGDAVLPAALREKIRASGAKRLVLVPDGALHKLPFEALLLSAPGGPRYALDELPPVCYAPSIGALAVVLSRPRATDATASLLTVGDPAYPEAGEGTKRSSGGQLPRLPYTATESRKVRQHFPADKVVALERDGATEQNVVAAMPGKRFVHLAAHGFADEAFGNAFAAVALTPPPRGSEEPGNDGFLTLHEISRLKLTGCELTVLSACVTNVGPQRPLEAGVTLAGAFLGAGSRGVMASCWSVDDRATAEMMSGFFGAIRAGGGKGTAYPEALRDARLAVKRTPGWEAPFFWAPFVYVGPPD
ncbi:CHAT domain-containing protein [Gemmata sp. JC717]|uniref:CHAT domain-containing tetratricopeptide repeat protein n=1 Tax=Gemmata algarum TaxID=2975278 RepID=UPI0021BA92B2|nr:CHAT domain-containing protein [Gemmata algarum]MDY3551181.1 CHAT domain-containing protein [Gemmata algarum]